MTVVIPTWNRARLVCEAVESALNQRPGAVEVIVVDDASTDTTAGLLQQTFGSRIRLLSFVQRRGPGAARNAGARLARGKFVAFLDSDDLWLPGKLEAELRVLAEFPAAGAVVSDSRNFFEGKPDHASRFAQNGLLAATQGKVRLAQDCEWLWTNSINTVHACSITVRRETLDQLGPTLFAEDLVCCEDWEFQLRLYHRCQVVVLPEVWSLVRRFDDETRLGRGVPGRPRSREQELILLRSRLAVMERSTSWLHGLPSNLLTEFERFGAETAAQLRNLRTTNS